MPSEADVMDSQGSQGLSNLHNPQATTPSWPCREAPPDAAVCQLESLQSQHAPGHRQGAAGGIQQRSNEYVEAASPASNIQHVDTTVASSSGAGMVGIGEDDDVIVSDVECSDDAGVPDRTKGARSSRPKQLSSRYRGVCWSKKNKRWQAAINSFGKYRYLGLFKSEEEAARAFDRAAIKLRGHKARINFTMSDYVDEQGRLVEDERFPWLAGLQGGAFLGTTIHSAATAPRFGFQDSLPSFLGRTRPLQGLGSEAEAQEKIPTVKVAGGSGSAPAYTTMVVQGELITMPSTLAAAVAGGNAKVEGIIPSGNEDVYVLAYMHTSSPHRLGCVLVDKADSPQELGSYQNGEDAKLACAAVLTIYLKMQDKVNSLTSQLSKAQQGLSSPAVQPLPRFDYIPLKPQVTTSHNPSLPTGGGSASQTSTGALRQQAQHAQQAQRGAAAVFSVPSQDAPSSTFQVARHHAVVAAAGGGPEREDRGDPPPPHAGIASLAALQLSSSHSHSHIVHSASAAHSEEAGALSRPQESWHIAAPRGGPLEPPLEPSQPSDLYYVNQPETTDMLLANLSGKRRREEDEGLLGSMGSGKRHLGLGQVGPELHAIACLSSINVAEVQKVLVSLSSRGR